MTEENDTNKFINESTLGTVQKILKEEMQSVHSDEPVKELGKICNVKKIYVQIFKG